MSNTSIVWLILGGLLILFISALIYSKRFRRIIKIKILRRYIKWREYINSVNKKMSPLEKKLTSLQEKTILLWKLCLKDKETELRSSIIDSIRQIDKDNMMMILKPSSEDYVLTILDFDMVGKKNCYEVHIPKAYVDEICDLFDTEMSRRMRSAENLRREIIDDDLDKLISLQEKRLKLLNRESQKTQKGK